MRISWIQISRMPAWFLRVRDIFEGAQLFRRRAVFRARNIFEGRVFFRAFFLRVRDFFEGMQYFGGHGIFWRARDFYYEARVLAKRTH